MYMLSDIAFLISYVQYGLGQFSVSNSGPRPFYSYIYMISTIFFDDNRITTLKLWRFQNIYNGVLNNYIVLVHWENRNQRK